MEYFVVDNGPVICCIFLCSIYFVCMAEIVVAIFFFSIMIQSIEPRAGMAIQPQIKTLFSGAGAPF